MPNIFLLADPHFGHAGVCKFLRDDGIKLRPWDNPDEMDEALVTNWNKTVRPTDKVYVLGDVCINRRALHTVGRCNGDKILIKGNHDIYKLTDYTPYFRDIRGYHVMNKYLLSHIPVHPDSKGRFAGNIHGHLHANYVRSDQDGGVDPWYKCVSVEHIDYTPILFETLMKQMAERN